MLLICERTVLSVTPAMFAIFRGGVAIAQKQRYTALCWSKSEPYPQNMPKLISAARSRGIAARDLVMTSVGSGDCRCRIG